MKQINFIKELKYTYMGGIFHLTFNVLLICIFII
uniref:Uncharacterized protein n=1 Tax=Kuetzingia canaliculata TaxID=228262 RepID=A0A1Z1MP67_KUECA|nr:hypothetical protein [Kuetzingia canaliculata]ARW67883.1 hypothetical protein [Kuetzingia canaliculata]